MRTHCKSFVAVGLSVLALSCSSPTDQGSQPDEVSFMLQGQRYVLSPSTDYVTASITSTSLSVSANDYVTQKPSIELWIGGYQGARTYELGAGAEQDGDGRLIAGGVVYSTGYGGQGSVKVSGEACRTRTVYDPVTGITGPLTFCGLSGTFSFVGLDEAGASASITGGAFGLTAQKLQP